MIQLLIHNSYSFKFQCGHIRSSEELPNHLFITEVSKALGGLQTKQTQVKSSYNQSQNKDFRPVISRTNDEVSNARVTHGDKWNSIFPI